MVLKFTRSCHACMSAGSRLLTTHPCTKAERSSAFLATTMVGELHQIRNSCVFVTVHLQKVINSNLWRYSGVTMHWPVWSYIKPCSHHQCIQGNLSQHFSTTVQFMKYSTSVFHHWYWLKSWLKARRYWKQNIHACPMPSKYQPPATPSHSTNDENGKGWGIEKVVGKKRKGKKRWEEKLRYSPVCYQREEETLQESREWWKETVKEKRMRRKEKNSRKEVVMNEGERSSDWSVLKTGAAVTVV